MKKIRLILGGICCENAVKTIFFELHSIDGVEETHFDLASHSVLIYMQIKALSVIESKYQADNGCKLIPETTFKRGYNE